MKKLIVYSGNILNNRVNNLKIISLENNFVKYYTYLNINNKSNKNNSLFKTLINKKFCSSNLSLKNVKSNTIDVSVESELTMNLLKKKIIIPKFCNILQLSDIINQNSFETIKDFNSIIGSSIKEVFEYLNPEDVELYLLEKGFENFEINNKEDDYINERVDRPLIVTIMGHVDHGKTTLLDSLRQLEYNIADKEFGKITQTIGAFNVDLSEDKLNTITNKKQFNKYKATIIDTPGHEAFAKMRLRGAKITDLIILVISSTEGIKKQTKEVLDIIKTHTLPYIIAFNKFDLPDADIESIKSELKEDYNIITTEDKGDVPSVRISAKYGTNLDLLKNEMLKIYKKLSPKEEINISPQAYVIESKANLSNSKINSITNTNNNNFELDKQVNANLLNFGNLNTSVIIRKGVLKKGDSFICGLSYGKIKSMLDDQGNEVLKAYPGEAVEILGLKTPAPAGSTLCVVDNILTAENIVKEKLKIAEYFNFMKRENYGKGIKLGKFKTNKERKQVMNSNNKFVWEKKLQEVIKNNDGDNNADSLLNMPKNEYNKLYGIKDRKKTFKFHAKKYIQKEKEVYEFNDSEEKIIREVYLHEDQNYSKLIIKVDTDGVYEMINDELSATFDEYTIDKYIEELSVGQVTTEDIELAKSSKSGIICFNNGDEELLSLCSILNVCCRSHKLVFEMIEEIKQYIYEQMIYTDSSSSDKIPNLVGEASILEKYVGKHNNKTVNIAGIQVVSGNIYDSYRYRIINKLSVKISDIKVNSMKQNKISMNIIKEGQLCGLIFDNYNDFEVGDTIECYKVNEDIHGISKNKTYKKCYR